MLPELEQARFVSKGVLSGSSCQDNPGLPDPQVNSGSFSVSKKKKKKKTLLADCLGVEE